MEKPGTSVRSAATALSRKSLYWVKAEPFIGTKHTALHDAMYEAVLVLAAPRARKLHS
jgi:hypothetical protein